MKIGRFLFVALLAGCGGASTGITASCPSGSTLTYANFGQTFIADNCLGCHDTTRPVLTTQSAIVSNKSKILQEAVYTTSMPEDGSLTTAEREMLGEWLACGAP